MNQYNTLAEPLARRGAYRAGARLLRSSQLTVATEAIAVGRPCPVGALRRDAIACPLEGMGDELPCL